MFKTAPPCRLAAERLHAHCRALPLDRCHAASTTRDHIGLRPQSSPVSCLIPSWWLNMPILRPGSTFLWGVTCPCDVVAAAKRRTLISVKRLKAEGKTCSFEVLLVRVTIPGLMLTVIQKLLKWTCFFVLLLRVESFKHKISVTSQTALRLLPL